MTTTNNNAPSLLITTQLKEKLNELLNDHPEAGHAIAKLKDFCDVMKGQELRNAEAALRHGFMMTDRWSLELEVYDHILMRYNEEILTYEEFDKAKKSYEFFKKNFGTEEVTNG